MPPKPELSSQDITEALEALDARVGESELLMSVAPVRLMVSGGCLAVTFFHVRAATKYVDCLIDPNIDAADDYRQAVLDAVRDVAEAQGLESDWMNDQLKGFIARPKRLDLFLRSVEQGIVLYGGDNLIVYAASLEWALESKIRRVATGGARKKDVADAVAIIRHIKGEGPPLNLAYLRSLDFNGFETPMDDGVRTVRKEYEKQYGEVGVAEMVWDEEKQCYRYLDIDRNWQWVEE